MASNAKKHWTNNIGSSSGPIASVYWCKLCTGPHASRFRVVVTSRTGFGTASKAMAAVQAHIKTAHQSPEAAA